MATLLPGAEIGGFSRFSATTKVISHMNLGSIAARTWGDSATHVRSRQ